MREQIATWERQPVFAALFGSVARGEADERSDVDLCVVRPADVAEDDAGWREQVGELESAVTGWTGNDARTLEYGESELSAVSAEPVVRDIVEQGIILAGSRSIVSGHSRSARR